MPWFFLALLTAFIASLKDVFSKLAVRRIDPLVVAWSWSAGALPLVVPLALSEPPVMPQSGFWPALAAGSLLNVGATILYIRALQASDLSLTIPMIALTPLFMVVTSPLLVGEMPAAGGLGGILLIVAGSWTINIGAARHGFLAPFRALLREPGPRYMLLVALIWSVTANIDKIGICAAPPLTWIMAVDIVVTLLMLPLVVAPLRRTGARRIMSLLPIGICGGLVLICQMHAIEVALVSYVIAIKRTSILFGIAFGRLIFAERGIRERAAGALVMLAGVALIAWQAAGS
ncbi:MAG: DMT family transporter [Deltaproteobacteria bacterium]|nr:DMT family transporter [Candidatus Anaeroferrophillacea bacterium]